MVKNKNKEELNLQHINVGIVNPVLTSGKNKRKISPEIQRTTKQPLSQTLAKVLLISP